MTVFTQTGLTKFELLAATALTLICAAPALAGTTVYSDTHVIAPVDVVTPAVTTYHTENHQPPSTTTVIDDNGAVVQSTTSSSSSETFSESGYARPYHNRAYVPTGDILPAQNYSSTTVIHSEGQADMPGVMTLQDEANMTMNAVNPLYSAQ